MNSWKHSKTFFCRPKLDRSSNFVISIFYGASKLALERPNYFICITSSQHSLLIIKTSRVEGGNRSPENWMLLLRMEAAKKVFNILKSGINKRIFYSATSTFTILRIGFYFFTSFFYLNSMNKWNEKKYEKLLEIRVWVKLKCCMRTWTHRHSKWCYLL